MQLVYLAYRFYGPCITKKLNAGHKLQRSWIKIEVACGRNARQCHQGSLEACGKDALPYRAVERRVSAFRTGRNEMTHVSPTGSQFIYDEQVELVRGLLAVDHRWTVRELFIEVGLSHQTEWHILKKNLHMRKIAARWVPHNLTETQKWHRYAIAQLQLQRYHNEGNVFLQRIVAIDEKWAWTYEPVSVINGTTKDHRVQ
ncbi:hypothetical protein ANN_17482 [Periplaneta americana]|uniref:Uncharacterized protein n=1 Tax=Periplaneta americana TaxID=6978 RepID=A0ABQ8SU06_PERAM|nr:hypothetical protein ANN_17482 [Periplaneta americana]